MLNPDKVHRKEGSFWVSQTNFDPEVTSQFDWPDPLLIIDSTLRKMLFTAGALNSTDGFIRVAEALAEAGVKVGLPRDAATLLAAQTTLGAARMVLETGEHPALLKDAVTTPAGCTADGLLELEEGGLRVTLIKAVMRATERARVLAGG